jgi:hypothetical protein
MVAALVVAAEAEATQHLIRAGDDWSKLESKLQPGDEIILMPGTHRGAVLKGVAGTAEKPILIRPADRRVPVRIDATDVGIHLVSPSYITIESVAVVGATHTGVLIEGTKDAPAKQVMLNGVFVANTGDKGAADGIRIAHAESVTLDKCRIEGWHRAAVHVHAARDVAVRQVDFVGGAKSPERYGVAIDGESRNVTVERSKFGQGIVMALAIGLPESDSLPSLPPPPDKQPEKQPEEGPPALAESVLVERCISERAARFVALGSCRDTVIRANTILSPTAVWEVAATAPGWCAPDATFVSNLIFWEPGTLQRFALAAPKSVPAGIDIEVNLWWSLELAAAKATLGEFVGTVRSPQVLDVDPALDNFFEPRTAEAKAFGRNAP